MGRSARVFPVLVTLAGIAAITAACASGPAPGETVTTRHLIGEPGDPCTHERTVSRTEAEDGSVILAHGSYFAPWTEQLSDYQGTVTEFFGSGQDPDYSAIAVLFPDDTARTRFALEELAAWAANDGTVVNVDGRRVDREGGPSRVELSTMPPDRVARIELVRGCVVGALYPERIDRVATVSLDPGRDTSHRLRPLGTGDSRERLASPSGWPVF